MKLLLPLLAAAALAALPAAAGPAGAAPGPAAPPVRLLNHAVCRGYPLQGEFAAPKRALAAAPAYDQLALFERAALPGVPDELPSGADQAFEADAQRAVFRLPLNGSASGAFDFPTHALAYSGRYAVALCAAPHPDVPRLTCSHRAKFTVQRQDSPVCADEHQPSVQGVPVGEPLGPHATVSAAALVAGHLEFRVHTHSRATEDGPAWLNLTVPAGPGGVQFLLRVAELRPRLNPAPGAEVPGCDVHVHAPAGTVLARAQALREAGASSVRVVSASPGADRLQVDASRCAAGGLISRERADEVAAAVVRRYFRALAGAVARDPCLQRQVFSPVQSHRREAGFTLGVHFRRDLARANVVFKTPVLAEILGDTPGGHLLGNAVVHGTNASVADDLYMPEVGAGLAASPAVAARLAAAMADPDLAERAGRVFRRASAFLVALAETARHEEFLLHALSGQAASPLWPYDPETGRAAGELSVELLSLARAKILCAEQHTRIASREMMPDDSYGMAAPRVAEAERVAGEALSAAEEDGTDGAAAAAAAEHKTVAAQVGGKLQHLKELADKAAAAQSFLELAAGAGAGGFRLPLSPKAAAAVSLAAGSFDVLTRPVLRSGMAGTEVVLRAGAKGLRLRAGAKDVRLAPEAQLVQLAVLQRGGRLVYETAALRDLVDALGRPLAEEVAAFVDRAAGFAARSPCVQRFYPQPDEVVAETTSPRATWSYSFGGADVSASVRLAAFSPAIFRRQVPHRAREAGFRAVIKRAGVHALGFSLAAGDQSLEPRAWSHLLVNAHEILASSLASRGLEGVLSALETGAELWAGRTEETRSFWAGQAGGEATVLHTYAFLNHACQLREWVSASEDPALGDAARRAARARVRVELERVRQMRRLEDLQQKQNLTAPTRDEMRAMEMATTKAHVALDSLSGHKEAVARLMAAPASMRVNPFELAAAVREQASEKRILHNQRQRFERVAQAGGHLGVLEDVTLRELVLKEHELRAKSAEAARRADSRAAGARVAYREAATEEMKWLDRGGGAPDERPVELAPTEGQGEEEEEEGQQQQQQEPQQ